MVVSVDAGVAKGAVAAPRGPDNLAVRTQTTRLHRVEQLHEVEMLVLLQFAWVTCPDKDAEKTCCAEEGLTGDE